MTTALITGANRGIGLCLAQQLAERGVDLIAAVRRSSPELDALGARVEALDVADDASCENLARRLEGTPIDLLIHNAGLLERTSLDAPDFAAVRRMFEVNALGPLKLTVALRNNLKAASKVAIITSRMGSIADNDSGGAYGYRMSKAAVNAVGKSLAVDLAEAGVAVALLHPGWVRTGMTRHTGHLEPAESARGLLARIDALTLETSGTFWHQNGEVLPW